MIDRHGERAPVPATAPAPTITGGAQRRLLVSGAQANAAVRTIDEPAPTVMASWDNGDTKWVLDRRQTGAPRVGSARPAPTVTARAKAKDVWCWRSTETSEDVIRLTEREGLILQSFNPAIRIEGNKSERWTQIGNAVPPRLAAHIVAALTGGPYEKEVTG